jgi:hypothetical protein
MTSLHEWKHALQHRFKDYRYKNDPEADATTWSHTIFRLALPKLYERSLASGKFFHRPADAYPLHLFSFLDPQTFAETLAKNDFQRLYQYTTNRQRR